MREAAVREAAPLANPVTAPFAPISLNRPADGSRSVLKVAVFNARGGGDLRGIADRLRRPPLADVGTILACEASWRIPRHGRVKFAADLAAALKMSFAFAPSFGYPDPAGGFRAVGNAIICAQPLDDFRLVPLPRAELRFQPRGALPGVPQGLIANLSVVGHRLAIGVVHLDRRWSPPGRALQMEHFLAGLGDVAPAVIGGDFNTTTMDMDVRWSLARAAAALILRPRRFHDPQPYEPLFERLDNCDFVMNGPNVPYASTFTPSRIVPRLWRPKLDWLAARGLKTKAGSAAVIPARAPGRGRRISDHDFVICEFRFREGSPKEAWA